MSVSVTLTFTSMEEAITSLARLRTDAPPAPPVPDKAVAAPKPPAKAADKPKTEPAGTTAAPAAAPASAASSPAASAPATPASGTAGSLNDREAMKAEINAAIPTNKPVLLATLAKFSAKSGKDIPDDKIGEFRVALGAALAGGTEEEDLGG